MSSVLEELKRGIVHLVEENELRARLAEGRPLRIKVGFDPTAPDIHLGHTVLMRKMRQWQDFGHEVIFLIGDFTGMIGDPSGRSVTRPPLTREQIMVNAETYKTQAFKVLDPAKTRIAFNSTWLGALSSVEIVQLAAKVTVARILERDDFRKRLDANVPISAHEMLYPLFQGYDSVALQCDVEMGGADQLWNLLAGRDLTRSSGQTPQIVMTTPLLEGTDGVQKMSKSFGNYIGVTDPPREMFGKLMSISDVLMWRYYELLSARSSDEIRALRAGHPRDAKVALAMEIVERFHDAQAAKASLDEFERLFSSRSKNAVPDDVTEVSIATNDGKISLAKAIKEAGLAPSNTEATRLIKQGAVFTDGVCATDVKMELAAGKSHLIKVGKRRFARITLT